MGKLYKKAGVNVASADQLVRDIAPLVAGIGKFAASFDLGKANLTEPLLLVATDGVGTKTLLAHKTGLWGGIGQDLVAMSANDMATHGGQPLVFLDYLAMAALEPKLVKELVKSVAKACDAIGCQLVGGETAEMPDVYQPKAVDLAGFVVGAVEKSRYIDGSATKAGDVVIGWEASGAHSNGFSLIRKAIEGVDLAAKPPFTSEHSTIGEALMAPTVLYVDTCLKAMDLSGDRIRGFAHITGGGIKDNVARIIPDGLGARLRLPPLAGLFEWLQGLLEAPEAEMREVFNCGVGMVAVVAPEVADELVEKLGAKVLGEVEASSGAKVVLE